MKFLNKINILSWKNRNIYCQIHYLSRMSFFQRKCGFIPDILFSILYVEGKNYVIWIHPHSWRILNQQWTSCSKIYYEFFSELLKTNWINKNKRIYTLTMKWMNFICNIVWKFRTELLISEEPTIKSW